MSRLLENRLGYNQVSGSNTGGFQEIFGTIITGLGSKVQSSQYAAEAAESIKMQASKQKLPSLGLT